MSLAKQRNITSVTAFSMLISCVVDESSDDLLDLDDGAVSRMATPAADDPLPQQVLDDIAATLPEGQDATINHPELFPANFDPDPEVVSSDTDVWVTFVSEGAGQRNSMGFFTYPTGSPPASLSMQELEDGIIFPNASAVGSGGSLQNGSRRFLGTFQPGVQVGFFLIRNGSCNSGPSCNTDLGVDFSKTILYSVDTLNPEHATSPALARHVVVADLLNDPSPSARLLGWEDLIRTGGSDDDFNDVVFRVTAEPSLGGGGDTPTVPVCDPSPETCNGKDDDCDGVIDNGNPGGGGACSTGLPGACAAGTEVCQGGGLVCAGNAGPVPEVCDAIDNDCDGMIDEDGVCVDLRVVSYGTLAAYSALCTPGVGGDWFLHCQSAAARYCDATSGGDTGFAVEFDGSTGQAAVACLAGARTNTTYPQLSTHNASCNGAPGGYAGLVCHSATHRLCSSSGNASGFGPHEVAVPNAVISCLSPQRASVVGTNFGVLSGHHPQCNATVPESFCQAASHRFCQAQGFTSGYGPVEAAGNAAAVVCVD